jgi:hypothetical protein
MNSSGDSGLDEWYVRWKIITQHRGNLYSLPGGAVGRKYAETLTNEVLNLASNNFSSERLIVFSSLILHVIVW